MNNGMDNNNSNFFSGSINNQGNYNVNNNTYYDPNNMVNNTQNVNNDVNNQGYYNDGSMQNINYQTNNYNNVGYNGLDLNNSNIQYDNNTNLDNTNNQYNNGGTNNYNNVNINSDESNNDTTNFNSNMYYTNTSNQYVDLMALDFANTPIVDAANQILVTASDKGASDIHLDPAIDCLKVRFRIDGVLETYLHVPNIYRQNLTTRIKIMSGMNITETRLPQDGAIKTTINGINLDMRVSALPTKKGEKIVIRILDYSKNIKGIEHLYFSQLNYSKIVKMLNVPNGIILVTGATGSGKSTTVYSFLQRLNTEGTNIITVEDPVEMEIEGINQVQVNSDIGLDFAAVLRSILRQDPNIIMIGEIRDSETAKIAVRASITGHMVLSTIHTNNSLNTIERLLDMDVERYLLASSLEGIVSQKLARRLCDKCKKTRSTTQFEKTMFKNFLNMDVSEVYEPGECSECNHGYKGRIAIQEVLDISQDIRDAISQGLRKEELRKLVYTKDVISMFQDGLYKVVAGFTTIEEILKLIELDDEIEDNKELTGMLMNKNK